MYRSYQKAVKGATFIFLYVQPSLVTRLTWKSLWIFLIPGLNPTGMMVLHQPTPLDIDNCANILPYFSCFHPCASVYTKDWQGLVRLIVFGQPQCVWSAPLCLISSLDPLGKLSLAYSNLCTQYWYVHYTLFFQIATVYCALGCPMNILYFLFGYSVLFKQDLAIVW